MTLAHRLPQRLAPDRSRVVAQLFVPGHALGGSREGRASDVVEAILSLPTDEVLHELTLLWDRFGDRHEDLAGTFEHHAARIANRLEPGTVISDAHRSLLGATFTCEYALEGAALCNPSIVAAPDQSDVPPGAVRFVMSVRQIGEGHRSSIGFRTGILDADGALILDSTRGSVTTGTIGGGGLDRDAFAHGVAVHDREAIDWVLGGLAPEFSAEQLEARLAELAAQSDTRRNVFETVDRLRTLAARAYSCTFPGSSAVHERVLFPVAHAERNGMEDARFVRFVEDDGSTTFYATYTAYDGSDISLQLVSTEDFLTFSVAPLRGAAAANKGLALFPRRIGGRYAALSRLDGASNAVALSEDLRCWPTATLLEGSTPTWGALQVGNCGSPIETEAGWLVLTHGVGPMRSYGIGALLLDLDDPTKALGSLPHPLLRSEPSEQDGYVPNVVYTCGALLHGSTLLIPFGIGDASIGFATADIGEVLDAIRTTSPSPPGRC